MPQLADEIWYLSNTTTLVGVKCDFYPFWVRTEFTELLLLDVLYQHTSERCILLLLGHAHPCMEGEALIYTRHSIMEIWRNAIDFHTHDLQVKLESQKNSVQDSYSRRSLLRNDSCLLMFEQQAHLKTIPALIWKTDSQNISISEGKNNFE